MRLEYDVIQRLMWDHHFRREFVVDPDAALRGAYPDCSERIHALCRRVDLAGLEEEAYRRVSSFSRTAKDVFRHGYPLVATYAAADFYHEAVRRIFRFDGRSGPDNHRQYEILEPFDGYIVGPVMMMLAQEQCVGSCNWVMDVLRYDWAVWQASRVVEGWPPLKESPPLVPGATLVRATWDLKGLLREIRRLQISHVSSEVYRWRIRPGSGTYCAAVFPIGSSVAEVALGIDDYEAILRWQEASPSPESPLWAGVEEIGLVLPASFLCCSSEMAVNRERHNIDEVAVPAPH